jgi:hypothetical protein
MSGYTCGPLTPYRSGVWPPFCTKEGPDLPIHGRLANLQDVQGRRTEEGTTATTMVVETEDESG